MAGGPCASREATSPRTPADRGRARESMARDVARLAASFHTVGTCIARLRPVLNMVAAVNGANGGWQQWADIGNSSRQQAAAGGSGRRRNARRQQRSADRAAEWRRRREQCEEDGPMPPKAPLEQEAGKPGAVHDARRAQGGGQLPEEGKSRVRAAARPQQCPFPVGGCGSAHGREGRGGHSCGRSRRAGR